MNRNLIIPTILSGGSGTRLWPLSRAMYPKQFIQFFPDQDASFLGTALRRLSSEAGFAEPIILCNNDHRFLVREELERTSIAPSAIILEPVARNTAPAITIAALAALNKDPGAILVVMPSDHLIRNNDGFAEGVLRAAKVAASGRLVLFGIKPNEPHEGFGYIHRGAPLPGTDDTAFTVADFTEKPDRATAEQYLKDGSYYWNSGIFVLHARTYLDEIAVHAPEVLAAAKKALEQAKDDIGFLRLDGEAFAHSPNISVDYAVMEKTEKAVVLPLDVGWNDVGSWSSLWDIARRDQNGNYTNSDAILEDTADCYIHATKTFVSTIGVKNLVIVETPDALLVADKSRSQEVSAIVQRLKRSGRKEHEQHVRNYRPWGYFETMNIGQRFQVKLLHVKPGGKLSMQMHYHRSEHWVVVQGTAKITIGDKESLVRENESVYITATQWHRLENAGKVPVEIIEVQIGTYLGEDDIIRSDDFYRRGPDETK